MDTHEETSAFRSINIRDQLKSNVCVLLKLRETKLRRKSKIMLHGYRQVFSLHKNRRH